MDNWIYVGAAYGLTWAVLAAYAAYLHRATRQAAVSLERAEQIARISGER